MYFVAGIPGKQNLFVVALFYFIFLKRSTLYSNGFSDDSLTNRKKIIFIKACRAEKKTHSQGLIRNRCGVPCALADISDLFDLFARVASRMNNE